MKANSFFVGLKFVVLLLLLVVFSFVPLWEPLSSSLGQAAWASATTDRHIFEGEINPKQEKSLDSIMLDSKEGDRYSE